MTNIQLKTLIDSDITNKTIPLSLSNVNLGNDMKSIVDYIDQEITNVAQIEKTIKISLNSAQILDIFTTPIEIVPAIAGKLLIPRFIYQKYNHITTAYTGGATWRIGLGSVNNAYVTVGAVITSAINTEAIQALSQNWTTSGITFEGLNLTLGGTISDPTGGDGTLDLYITYLETTII